MSIKDQILKAEDRKKQKVTVKEWGVDVYISELSAAALDSWQEEVSGRKKDAEGIKLDSASLVARCMCDESGARIFGDKEIEALANKSGKVIKKLFDICLKVNGIGESAVEDLAKN